MSISLRLVPVTDLPDGIDILRAEARAERYRSLDRLAHEWQDGTCRFDRDGEALLAAMRGERMVGIGGLTHDPTVKGAMRMRRFYVSASMRRAGIGRALAACLLEKAARRPFMVNAGTTGAPAFWEALGFVPEPRCGHTHVHVAAGAPML